MAKNGDRLILIEFLEGATRHLIHRHQHGAGDVRGLTLPRLAHVEEQRRVLGGKLLFQLIDGDFQVRNGHTQQDTMQC